MIVMCEIEYIDTDLMCEYVRQALVAHSKMKPSTADLRDLTIFIGKLHRRQSNYFGMIPFSMAHSSVDLNVRVALTTSRSELKPYSIISLRVMSSTLLKSDWP